MAFTQVTWVATPDKTNHDTKGYTSKVIFNYQTISGISVVDGDEIFKTIIDNGNGKSFKGSNIIPRGYFRDCDGRTLKITMYFYKELDGNNMSLLQGLLDRDNHVFNEVATPTFLTGTSGIGDRTLAKYECVISSFFDPGFVPSGQYYIQGIGNITYANSHDGTSMIMQPYKDGNPLSGGITSEYELSIINNNNNDINVVSLIVEEIS
jgi:hypothetical protein